MIHVTGHSVRQQEPSDQEDVIFRFKEVLMVGGGNRNTGETASHTSMVLLPLSRTPASLSPQEVRRGEGRWLLLSSFLHRHL